ncbi:uncharacterized protein FFB20_13834 [Fusarium fujikuroi]|nr:uncharacterized protein FFE2_00325 [Fusarium fujikuroi]SCN69149.1 uncharacterized protein FFC1_00320 [Fusarium fujikuroi]SCO11489.1 uncharacterized protein FFB20_13834 [Fusarium fujikuroi]
MRGQSLCPATRLAVYPSAFGSRSYYYEMEKQPIKCAAVLSFTYSNHFLLPGGTCCKICER